MIVGAVVVSVSSLLIAQSWQKQFSALRRLHKYSIINNCNNFWGLDYDVFNMRQPNINVRRICIYIAVGAIRKHRVVVAIRSDGSFFLSLSLCSIECETFSHTIAYLPNFALSSTV